MLNLPEKYVEKLKAKSKETGLSMSDIVRRAIDAYYPETIEVNEYYNPYYCDCKQMPHLNTCKHWNLYPKPKGD